MSLQDTVNSIQEDFDLIKQFSNEDLLALCVKTRFEEINEKYEREFDRLLVSLDNDYTNNLTLEKLTTSMNSLSRILTGLSDTLINHLNFYKGDY